MPAIPSLQGLLNNAVMKEILTIRLDSLFRIKLHKLEDKLKAVEKEGSTGDLDNFGGLIVPGGLVFRNSRKKVITRTPYEEISEKEIRRIVRYGMEFDCATLLSHDSYAVNVKLDNGFYVPAAETIMNFRSTPQPKINMKDEPRAPITIQDIAKSYNPQNVGEVFGSKTEVTAGLAVCSTDPDLYLLELDRELKFESDEERDEHYNLIKTAKTPLISRKKVLIPPFFILYHTTRYKETAYMGLTKLMGYRKFGEFATLSFEQATPDLLDEIGGDKQEFNESEIITEIGDTSAVAVLRIYPRTNVGARAPRTSTHIVEPENDLGLNLTRIEREARERYAT